MDRQKPYWYYQLKFSWPGRIFTRLRHPFLKRQVEQAKHYYSRVLPGAGGLIFDIGANVGDLSAVFLSMGYTVVACEPDPVNFRILQARFSGNTNITLLQKAVAQHRGEAMIYPASAHGGSLTTLSEKRRQQLEGINDEEGIIHFDAGKLVALISLDDMIATYGLPVFIKIDVEGFEQQVLSGLSQPVPQLSFEANLPEFMEETLACLKLLVALDDQALFNISTDDQSLVFEQFQSNGIFLTWFKQQEDRYAEVFCSMTNFTK